MTGIDLGSRTVKIVAVQDGAIIRQAVYDTISFYRNYAKIVQGQLVLERTGLGLDGNDIIATGYGKITAPLAGGRLLPEIQAHVWGAKYQTGESDFILLDIGGQDSKVICVRQGRAVDFLTNDRCAAGSGRYLENMAQIIGMDLDVLGDHYLEPVALASTCAIFSETEIISRIVEGCSDKSLAAGINHALYMRLAPMLKKLAGPKVLLAGGGAANRALRYFIEKDLHIEAVPLPFAQINGALGCCAWGIEQMYKERV